MRKLPAEVISEIYSYVSGKGDDSVVDAENMPETGIEEEQIINLSEAKKALNDLFNYFEKKEFFEDKNFLNSFNTIQEAIQISNFKNVQSTIDSYFNSKL